jgi:LCP family protein required for cell wall assembly
MSDEKGWPHGWARDDGRGDQPEEPTIAAPAAGEDPSAPRYFEPRTYGPGSRAPKYARSGGGRRLQNVIEDQGTDRYRQYGTSGSVSGTVAQRPAGVGTADQSAREGIPAGPSPGGSRLAWLRRLRLPRRGVRRWLLVLLVLLLVVIVGTYFYFDSKLNRIDAMPEYDGRPAATPGQDWLLVGSDSRAGLSAKERAKLATGSAGGRRTDTMMLLHIPSGGGKPTLVSLPRDSYVPIPGHGRNKLNAAFAFGGPKLLIETVEMTTGIRIDRYMEIGFGGFVDVVDALGGVHMCIPEAIKDRKAALDIKAGCQDLNGATALGYVRTRATARADLDRVQRQRAFFAAVVHRASSPSVLFNPFRMVPLARGSADALAVDDGTHLWDLGRLAWAMRSSPVTTTVPVASTPTIAGVGSVVQWDREDALRLFHALADDKQIPADLTK